MTFCRRRHQDSNRPERSELAGIYERHLPFVRGTLRRLGVSPGSVDDAAQDVFVVVHRRLDTYDDGLASLRSWLFGIAQLIALRYARWERRKGAADGLPPEVPESGPGPEERVCQAEVLAACLGTLDDTRRTVFVLAEFEQMSCPEIAHALNVNLNTVYSRLRRLSSSLPIRPFICASIALLAGAPVGRETPRLRWPDSCTEPCSESSCDKE